MFHLVNDENESDNLVSNNQTYNSQDQIQAIQNKSNFDMNIDTKQNSNSYIDNTDNIYLNNNEFDINQEIPHRTEWKIESSCCCYCCNFCKFDPFKSCNEFISPCVSIQSNRRKREFWGFLELDLFGPIFVLFLIILGNVVFANTVLRFLKNEYENIFIVEVIICVLIDFMLLWAFYGASCGDPGFMPFDWESLIPKKAKDNQINFDESISIPKFGWRDQLSGLAVDENQIEYAKQHRPPFASFSKTAGRYIIRADHICAWTGNWVGKRNHKQFILSAFWTILMLSNFIYWHSWCVFAIEKGDNKSKSLSVNRKYIIFLGPIYTVLQFLAIMIESFFLFAIFCMFCDILIDIIRGVTKIQNWKMENNQIKLAHRKWMNLSQCMRNLREVCGNSCILCWIIPFHAFDDIMTLTEDELLPQMNPIMY